MIPSEKHLLELLSNNDVTFFIPPYQRNYEWEKEQCAIFLEDIIKTTKKNILGNAHTEHFFGTITFFSTGGGTFEIKKMVLIDGQQRITTTMLFLVAVRDVISQPELKNIISSKYLKNEKVTDDTEYKIKLKQVETDWEVYCNIILDNPVSEKDKLTAVYQNYNYFKNELIKLKDENVIPLEKLIEYGLGMFSIVAVELQPDRNSWENPQEIFESMNSLGKPLSLADLVINYLLLGKNPDEQNLLYKNYWLQIEKRLPGQVSVFIRDYMQYKDRRAFKQATDKNYKELYSWFKSLFQGTDTEILLKDLTLCSEYYASIIGLSDVPTGNKELNNVLNDIRIIGATTAYSFILGLLIAWHNKDFSTQELIIILGALKIYFIRRRICALTGAENKAFPVLIRENLTFIRG